MINNILFGVTFASIVNYLSLPKAVIINCNNYVGQGWIAEIAAFFSGC
jgi:hypothetical protein